MWTLVVVEPDEAVYSTSKFVHRFGGVEIDPFLFDGSPEAFYPDVVLAAALAVHAHLDAMAAQQILPCFRGVLAALVGVANLRCSPQPHTVLHQLMAVVGRERVAELPAHDEATEDVDDGIQVHEAVLHGNVADVRAPHLVGSCDGHPA